MIVLGSFIVSLKYIRLKFKMAECIQGHSALGINLVTGEVSLQ